MERSMNTTNHDEVTLIDKDRINAQEQVWQNMRRFMNKLI